MEPKTRLEKILCDADLDHFGRPDFFELDAKLRQGRRNRGVDVDDDVKWYKGTLDLMKNRQFYTESQKKLREKEKQKNIQMLSDKLEDIEKEKNNPQLTPWSIGAHCFHKVNQWQILII